MMLQIRDINIKFKDFQLQNISLTFNRGEYHILLGPSGSGKTLILNIIAGFIKIDSGQIIYENIDITNQLPQNRNISYLFQDLALFPHMTVAENIVFPLKIRKLSKIEIEKKLSQYLEFVEIQHLRNRSVIKLSGGEKQRVALARQLITGANLIMLDEPFSAIDTQLRLSLKKLLKKISETGISIIHVTHNIEEALNLANRISVIENGEIVTSGSVDEVLNAPVNKFIADFSGHRNFYYCREIINKVGNSFINISVDTKANKCVKIEAPDSLPDELRSIIIDSSSIILSENKLESSARNNFEGVVTTVFRTHNSYEAEIDIGIPIWVKLTENSIRELDVKSGKKVWICFKASAIRFI